MIRRRPTRRHRRNRLMQRGLIAVIFSGAVVGFAAIALLHLSPSRFGRSNVAESDRQAIEASQNILRLIQQESSKQMGSRPVFPYSVVSGGVNDARELKWVADHDPVVKSHYTGFDYEHAQVVRLVLARTAYTSYRIGNKVYWTRHRVKLKKGETVITDGKMTARSRCANRVEDVPQQATSSVEPPATMFDQPVHPGTGTAVATPPVPFESALLNRPELGSAPLSLVDPFGNGTWVPITPPPLPGVCVKKTKNATGTNGKGNPCPNGGGEEVPKPGTWLLVAAGLAAILLKSRQRFAWM